MEMNNRYSVVNCEVLNLRNQPSLASDIIDKIPEGTEVYIDEKYFNKYFLSTLIKIIFTPSRFFSF